MLRVFIALVILLAPLVFVAAQDDTPALPRVPRGFDEGRNELVREAGEGMVSAGALVERLFEYADTHALAGFISLHLTKDEKFALGEQLKVGDKLGAASDAAAVAKLLEGKQAQEISRALGRMLAARKLSTKDVVAWLASRDFNFRAIQQAMNGERIDAFRVKAAVRGADVATALTVGTWEYNLLDAREEKGGHYDGVQLVEVMLALGFKVDDFEWVNLNADKAAAREMSDYERALVHWGDPALIWETFNARIPESAMFKAMIRRQSDLAEARDVAALRADTTLRWLRTGGAGVKAVYQGPWPDNHGAPVPPTEDVLAIGDVDVMRFANALSKPILGHFEQGAETITIVVYEDGSSRAILDKPSREVVNYGPDSPFGNKATTRQAYEGRVSLAGHSALLYLVHNGKQKVAPPQFELANLKLVAGGAFLVADIDDGLNLVPILLKRVTRLVE